jgi:CRP/FNR family transcriptional regulator, cyclic AMP receptor protein
VPPPPSRVRLLEVDSDLLEGLDEATVAEATASAVATVRTLGRGRWAPKADEFGSRSGFGLLILEGFVARRVALGERSCAELLGPESLLQPWLDDGEFAVMPFAASFTVLEPVSVAVLDGGVAASLSRWPAVVRNLMARALVRSRYMAGHLTLTQFPRVDTRLLVLLWHLGERFGRMTPDGVVVRLPLSHELIGDMIAARRQSVTTALGQLEERGHVLSRARHE